MKKIIVAVLILTMALAFTGCGQADEDQPVPYTATAEEMGFTMELSAELINGLASQRDVWTWDQDYNGMVRTEAFSKEIEGVQVPLFEVRLYEGEFDAETLETYNPLMVWVGTANGYTYTIFYSEEAGGLLPEEKLGSYNDIMNQQVAGLEERMTIEGVEKPFTTGFVNTLKGTDMELKDVAMVDDVNEPNGYRLDVLSEEPVLCDLSNISHFYVLDENFQMTETDADGFASRVAGASAENYQTFVRCYKTEGNLTTVCEQYLP